MSKGERNKTLYVYHVSRDCTLYKIVCASEEEAMGQKTINERIGGIILKTILTDKEHTTLKSMSLYWEEVRQREDTSPLEHEIQQVYRMLGLKLLDIVEEYLNLTKERVAK